MKTPATAASMPLIIQVQRIDRLDLDAADAGEGGALGHGAHGHAEPAVAQDQVQRRRPPASVRASTKIWSGSMRTPGSTSTAICSSVV